MDELNEIKDRFFFNLYTYLDNGRTILALGNNCLMMFQASKDNNTMPIEVSISGPGYASATKVNSHSPGLPVDRAPWIM